MNETLLTPSDLSYARLVPAGDDRFGAPKDLGISSIVFKITSQESKDLFAVEVVLTKKGGPARHIHHYQDEWWYILEGEFIVEVGQERFHLKPGDSLYGAREIPHVWAFVEGKRGRFLGSLMPAGNAEAFFIHADQMKTAPGSEQNQWQPYGMEWVGPPLQIK